MKDYNEKNEGMSKMDLVDAYEQVSAFVQYLETQISNNEVKEE